MLPLLSFTADTENATRDTFISGDGAIKSTVPGVTVSTNTVTDAGVRS
jgi:hypothetical protein